MSSSEIYWWEVIGRCPNPEEVGLLLQEAGAGGCEWRDTGELHCFFQGSAKAHDGFVLAAKALGLEHLHSERLPLKDWDAEAVREWQPLIIGKFVLSPLVESADGSLSASSNPFELFIHFRSGFGTGHHETTADCLRILETLELKFPSILDVGTGSGVLAMAAVRLFGGKAVGIDIDDQSLRNALINVRSNGLEGIIELSLTPLESLQAPVDLILANIYAEYHEKHFGDYERLLCPGGRMILSGIEDSVWPGLSSKLAKRWVQLLVRRTGKWVTALYRMA